MASVTILSDNGATSGSAGLKTSGGNDGVLLLQTTTSGGTPTTAISISNTQVVTYTNQPTYSGGTANGVLYLNGSKAVTSGTALVFDGSNLGIGTSAPGSKLDILNTTTAQAQFSYSATIFGRIGRLSSGNYEFSAYENGANLIFGTSTTNGSTTERMRLDASGNLGLGVTPSAWVSSWRALGLGGSTGFGGSLYVNAGGTTGQIGLAQNWYYDGANNRYITSAAASDYYQFGGAHVWRTAGSGTAGNAISFTQAMTLDASGDLLLGTTTSSGGAVTVGGSKNSIRVANSNAGIYFGTAGSPTGSAGFSSNPSIARAADVNYHISGSAIGDFCIGMEGGKRILFGYGATQGGGLNQAMIINSSGSVQVIGALSKGSGSFRIDHPLSELEETHELVHSFIEGPQADNLYRGKVTLVSGLATVNIDQAAGMTDGTFVVLNREVQCFTTNETGWTAVRGSVTGNVLTIEAQDNTCTDTISWLVVGERKDKHMYDTDWTDENGKVIVEPLKPGA